MFTVHLVVYNQQPMLLVNLPGTPTTIPMTMTMYCSTWWLVIGLTLCKQLQADITNSIIVQIYFVVYMRYPAAFPVYFIITVKPLITDTLKKKQTTSVQWTNSMPPIALQYI